MNAYLLDPLLSLHLLEAHRRLSLGVESVELQVLVVASFFGGGECWLVLELRSVLLVALRRRKRESEAVGVDGESDVHLVGIH